MVTLVLIVLIIKLQFTSCATKIAIIYDDIQKLNLINSTIQNINQADISYLNSAASYCSINPVSFDYILLFETNLLKKENCLLNYLDLTKTKLLILNNNNLFVSNLLFEKHKEENNIFILNKNFIFNDVLNIHLKNNRYYHVVYLVSSSTQYESIKDELSSYLKCNIYYKCNFEITFILFNQTCIDAPSCLLNKIKSNLNIKSNNQQNVTTNQLYKDDAILFLIAGNLNQLQLIYDKLLKFIYEISFQILDKYNNFDFIVLNTDHLSNANDVFVCEWFSSLFLNYLNNNLNRTINRNYYEIRKIYYIKKDNNEMSILNSLCNTPSMQKLLFSNYPNKFPFNLSFVADAYDGLKLLEFLMNNENISHNESLNQANKLSYFCQRKFNEFGFNEMYNLQITNILQYNYNNNTCYNILETYETLKAKNELFYDANSNEQDSRNTLLVMAVMEEPFIFTDSKGNYKGYCIDLLNEISKRLSIEYKIQDAPSADYGEFVSYVKNINGTIAYKWTGAMGELLNNRIDLITGKFILNSLRDEFIDFSIPYYDDGGIALLIKRPKSVKSLFLFIEVFSYEVWLSIVAIIAGTAFLVHLFERIRIYLSKANEQYGQDEIQFNISDSIWITIGSFTLAGGVSPPRAISICILISSFWFLSAICISTYQANLSAFLTSSKLQTQITSIKDLLQQTNLEYSTVDGSTEQNVFLKLRNLELEFYALWKNISLSSNAENTEDYKPVKAYAVWDYPLPDTYTRLLNSMNSSGWVDSINAGIERILNATDSLPYAFIIEYPKAKYIESKNCDLMTLETQFAQKSYAFGFPTGSPLRQKFSKVLLELKSNNFLQDLQNKWWPPCNVVNTEASITLDMVGGSFIMLGVGICLAFIVLFIQSMTLRAYGRKSIINDKSVELNSTDSKVSSYKLNGNANGKAS